MDDFLARYGLSMLIALAILGVLILAEWNDRKHEDPEDDGLGALEEYSGYLAADRHQEREFTFVARAAEEDRPRYVSAYSSDRLADEADEDDSLFSEETRRRVGLTPAASPPPRYVSQYR